MRVKKVNLGNGVFRLEVEPMLACETNLPEEVINKMVKDFIVNERGGDECCGNHRCFEPKRVMPNREPDGIDIHVDRPLRENFFTHIDWCDAMAKYRTLEKVAKDCNWKCREPMKGTHPNYNFIREAEQCRCNRPKAHLTDEDCLRILEHFFPVHEFDWAL